MEDVFRQKKSKENRKMSIFDYLRERPLIEAIREWFHNLVESFIDVSSDVSELRDGGEVDAKVIKDSWKNIEKIEEDHLKGGSYVINYKDGKKVTINSNTHKKLKEKAPNNLDLER